VQTIPECAGQPGYLCAELASANGTREKTERRIHCEEGVRRRQEITYAPGTPDSAALQYVSSGFAERELAMLFIDGALAHNGEQN